VSSTSAESFCRTNHLLSTIMRSRLSHQNTMKGKCVISFGFMPAYRHWGRSLRFASRIPPRIKFFYPHGANLYLYSVQPAAHLIFNSNENIFLF
jgi:hypothetical protein